MSVLFSEENRNTDYNIKEISNISNYLWPEINTYKEKYQNISTQEESFNNKFKNNKLLQIHKPKSILDSKFYLIKKIGHGFSGKVYLGFHKDSLNEQNEKVKLYSIKLMNTEKINLNSFKNEIELLEKINHKNILKIFAYGNGPKVSLDKSKNKTPKEFYYIVMEYLEHGELYKYITNVIKNENTGFGENLGRLIFSQLLDGLEAMHNLNICHRDIKLNNILIGEDDYILKYVDFGMATEEKEKLDTFLGTPNYAAPELHMKKPYFGKSEDIFSLGVTLFVLVTGRLPFKYAIPNDSLYQYIARGDYIEFWKQQLIDVSPSFMELFDNMVAFDFSQRPSISEIRQSSWMKEINWGLMPFLKEEFKIREEKIKNNEENNIQKIKSENKYINILSESNKDKSNENNNQIKETDLNESKISDMSIEEESKYNDDKCEGELKIKTKCKNLYQHINNMKRFLKKEGFIKYGGNIKKYELEVTNGEVDIFLHLQKFKAGYVKLNYNKINGTFQSFEKFKNLLVNIRQIIKK